MCVTVAIKLPRSRRTGLPKKDARWVLFKIRDRAYDPEYSFKTYNDGKRTSLFLVDEDSDWTECIRVSNETGETELMFVNSALNNSLDKKDGKRKPSGGSRGKKTADHGLIARRVARSADLDGAVKTFTDMKFDGCTFISDGEKCWLIESSLPATAKRQISKNGRSGKTFRAVATVDDFITTIEEITDWLAVRTNHGITNKEAGYQRKDGLSFESSARRREYAEDFIQKNIFEVSDILPAIDSMGLPSIDENAFLRPRRVASEIRAMKEDPKLDFKTVIYSTSAFVMTSHGNVQIKLYDAEINKVNVQRIYNKEFPVKVTITR